MTPKYAFPQRLVTDKRYLDDVTVICWEVEKLRLGQGIPRTPLDEELMRTAQAKAEHMNQYNYFGHLAPDGTPSPLHVGENLGLGQQSGMQVFKGWLSSPGHLMNMVNPEYTRMGIGIVRGPKHTFWVQHFSDDDTWKRLAELGYKRPIYLDAPYYEPD